VSRFVEVAKVYEEEEEEEDLLRCFETTPLSSRVKLFFLLSTTRTQQGHNKDNNFCS
jgi:hypothetical protein